MRRLFRGGPQLARLYGVELSYIGMGGERRRADPDALRGVLRALGADLSGPGGAESAIDARTEELERTLVEPVHVAWGGSLPLVPIRLPHDDSRLAMIQIRLESGEVVNHDCRAEVAARRGRNGWSGTHVLRFGRRLPFGYHRMQVETSGMTCESLIISAPRKAFPGEDTRSWGTFAPLYAVHSGNGVGTFTDLRSLAAWTADLGGDFVSTLPLLATFLDAPFEPSPYSPASRLFWNELFVDPSRVPGAGPALTAGSARDGYVDYRGAAAQRRRQLTDALGRADDEVRARMEEYATATPHADEYARFRAVCDHRREGWPVWPARLRDGDLREGDYAPEDRDYHLFAQWQADTQLGGVTRDQEDLTLYLDMPLGVHPDSFDAWRFRDLFASNVSAGAPPDPLFTGGQDWGFRPMLPEALRRTGYSYVIETIRHHLRHAGMLRLDHVMSLYRLYWIPEGAGAADGIYVRYADDELFAVLVLESSRHRAVVIGEDLGTVPDAVRRKMDRHGIHRMHVVQFEANPDGNPPVATPAEHVIASLNTHDMPMFAGFWRGTDIDDQLALGLIDAEGHRSAMQQRARLRQRLGGMLGGGGDIDASLVRQRLLEILAGSPAHYVLVTLEDLWGEDRPQNVPGTTAEQRPNWQRLMSRNLDDIMNDAALRRMLRAVDQRRQQPIPETQ